jgi:hypothetical protein
LGLREDRVAVTVVGQAQAQLLVDLSLVLRVGLAQHGEPVPELSDQRLEFGAAHPRRDVGLGGVQSGERALGTFRTERGGSQASNGLTTRSSRTYTVTGFANHSVASFQRALLGTALTLALYGIPYLLAPHAIGGGDVKLAGLRGLVLASLSCDLL